MWDSIFSVLGIFYGFFVSTHVNYLTKIFLFPQTLNRSLVLMVNVKLTLKKSIQKNLKYAYNLHLLSS